MPICIECRHCTTNRDGLGRLRYWCGVHDPVVSCGEERRGGECGRDGKLFVEKGHQISDTPIANAENG